MLRGPASKLVQRSRLAQSGICPAARLIDGSNVTLGRIRVREYELDSGLLLEHLCALVGVDPGQDDSKTGMA